MQTKDPMSKGGCFGGAGTIRRYPEGCAWFRLPWSGAKRNQVSLRLCFKELNLSQRPAATPISVVQTRHNLALDPSETTLHPPPTVGGVSAGSQRGMLTGQSVTWNAFQTSNQEKEFISYSQYCSWWMDVTFTLIIYPVDKYVRKQLKEIITPEKNQRCFSSLQQWTTFTFKI